MHIEFDGPIWYWRGPSPWFFVSVPEDACVRIRGIARSVTYGWGMIPARVRIGATEWKTSLWPKDGGYIVPVNTSIRRAEQVGEGAVVRVRLEIGGS